jgi:hypothetical protein
MLRRVFALLITFNFAVVGLAARPCLAGCAKHMARTCCSGEAGIRGPSCCPPADAEIKVAASPALHTDERSPLTGEPMLATFDELRLVAASSQPLFSGKSYFPPGSLLAQHTSLLL